MSENTLKRELGFFSAAMLVIASMVGTGIFTTSGFIIAELGDPRSMLFCWLAGGLFALCGALCYGELGAMYPEAGGEYVFLRESFGKWMGFLSGWVSLIVGFSAPIAASSLAFSTYLLSSFPVSVDLGLSLTISGTDIVTLSFHSLLAIIVIIVFSIIHCQSLSMGQGVQNALTLFKTGFIILFILAGFFLGDGSTTRFFDYVPDKNVTQGNFAISLIFVSFAYSGWNAVAYLGGEVKNPERNIPLALSAGTFIVIFLYLLLNIVYIYALPVKEMNGLLEVGIKSASSLFGNAAGKYFGCAISICLLSVTGALIMTGPRVYYAMAKDNIFFSTFARVSKSRGTPVHAVIFQSVIAAVMVLTASFERLLLYIGFTLSLFAMLAVVGMMMLRKKRSLTNRGYSTIGYPVTPLLFISGNLWIIYFSIRTRPVASLFGLGTVALGIVFYLYFRRKGEI